MILSNAGIIVSDFFSGIPTYHKHILLDEWVIMSNHFHCFITLGDYDFDNGVSDVDGNIGGVGGDGVVDKIHEFYLRITQPIKPKNKTSTRKPYKNIPKITQENVDPNDYGKIQNANIKTN